MRDDLVGVCYDGIVREMACKCLQSREFVRFQCPFLGFRFSISIPFWGFQDILVSPQLKRPVATAWVSRRDMHNAIRMTGVLIDP